MRDASAIRMADRDPVLDDARLLTEAMERVARLQPVYARSVRGVLAQGDVFSREVLLPLVDRAREMATARLSEWRREGASQRDALEAFEVVASLMEIVCEVAPRSAD
jgi:hypothetical protein